MIALSIGKATYDTTVPMDGYPTENSKIVLKEKIENSGGSACNVATLFSKWNNETYFAGVVGYDDYGSYIKKELESDHISVKFMETNYEKKTTTSFIISNKTTTSRTILMIEPEVFHLKKSEFDIKADIVYSDGFEYTATTTAFNKYQTSVTVLGASLDNGSDPKEVLALAKYAKYVIFSLEFAEQLTRLKVDFNDSQTLLNLYREVKDKYPNSQIVITLKNIGAMYQVANEVKVMPTIQVEEVDRTGAGDIFDGAFAYGLGKGYSLENCIRIANIAAGLSTTKYGAKSSIPLLSDVIQYYERKFGPLEVAPSPVIQNEQNSLEQMPNQQSGSIENGN